MSKLGDNYAPPAVLAVDSFPSICKWILSVLNKAVAKTVSSFESYRFSDATTAAYSWWQFQLCDVFIEAIKPYFFNDSKEFELARAASRDTLWVCLDTGLRLLHPFMPFVTEELWQRLPQSEGTCRKESIMISEYPSVVEVKFVLWHLNSPFFWHFIFGVCTHQLLLLTALDKWSNWKRYGYRHRCSEKA